jgi:hypothetical protein
MGFPKSILGVQVKSSAWDQGWGRWRSPLGQCGCTLKSSRDLWKTAELDPHLRKSKPTGAAPQVILLCSQDWGPGGMQLSLWGRWLPRQKDNVRQNVKSHPHLEKMAKIVLNTMVRDRDIYRAWKTDSKPKNKSWAKVELSTSPTNLADDKSIWIMKVTGKTHRKQKAIEQYRWH